MNYDREPCRPVYTQQQATSSVKSHNLAFKRIAQYNNNSNSNKKRSMTLNLKKNRLLIMHILPGKLPDYLTFRHGLRKRRSINSA